MSAGHSYRYPMSSNRGVVDGHDFEFEVFLIAESVGVSLQCFDFAVRAFERADGWRGVSLRRPGRALQYTRRLCLVSKMDGCRVITTLSVDRRGDAKPYAPPHVVYSTYKNSFELISTWQKFVSAWRPAVVSLGNRLLCRAR